MMSRQVIVHDIHVRKTSLKSNEPIKCCVSSKIKLFAFKVRLQVYTCMDFFFFFLGGGGLLIKTTMTVLR
jgi:hypothetical protein